MLFLCVFICWCRNLFVVLQSQTAGCSSVRLEYSSGGRVVAGSNPVIPTLLVEEKRLPLVFGGLFCCLFLLVYGGVLFCVCLFFSL